MAEEARMTVAEVVANVLAGEHGDVLREAVAIVARELMEAEVSAEIGAGRGEVSLERADASQRLPAARLGDPGRRAGAGDPAQALGRGLLPVLPGAAAALASRRSSRSCWRRTSTASPPGRSIGWSSSSASRG